MYKILFMYPGDQNEDIRRCLLNLLETPVGTVPLDRDFGIDQSFIDAMPEVAKNLLMIELIEKVERYEPRVAVEDVKIINTIGEISVEVIVRCLNT